MRPSASRSTARVTSLLLLVVALLATVLPASSAGAAVDVRTIPSLQQWDSRPGWFTLGSAPRVVVPAGDTALRTVAETFADDLSATIGVRPAVSTGAPGRGDIALSLGSNDTQLGDQGYAMAIGSTVAVTARTGTGAFNATRSLLQLLRRSTTVPAGTARDWPAHPVRAVLIDNFPRHYSLEWWKNLIREMSYVKINETHLYVDGAGMTKAELAEIDRFAQRYHVTVVPQLNVPGHMHAALPAHPEYQLRRKDGTLDDVALDLTNPAARQWAIGLVTEYLDLFQGPYWHMGADEYPSWNGNTDDYPQLDTYAKAQYGPNANLFDLVAAFQNELNAAVKAHGKQMRVWNDMIRHTGVVRLDPDVDVEYWIRVPHFAGQLSVQELIDRGHEVLNVHADTLYYDMSKRNLDPQKIYEQFDVDEFHDGQRVIGDDRRKVLGARIAVWMAHTGRPMESDLELLSNLRQPLRSMAQVVWGSPRPSQTYSGFRQLGESIGAPPGFVAMGNTMIGDPVTVKDVSGRLNWFATSADGRLHTGRQHDPGKSPWDRAVAAEGVTGQPAVVTGADGRLAFLARTSTGSLVHGWQQAAGSETWQTAPVPVAAVADPVLYLDPDKRLNALVETANGLVHLGPVATGSSTWGVPRDVVRSATGRPAVAVDRHGITHVVTRTSSGQLMHAWYGGTGSWRSARLTGTKVAGDPTLTLDNTGVLNTFAVDATRGLQHGSLTGSGTWRTAVVAHDVAGRPSVELDAAGRLAFAVRTTGGQLRFGWQSAPGSTTWNDTTTGSGVGGDPVLHHDAKGNQLIFARTANGALLHARQRTPGESQFDTALQVESVTGQPSVAKNADGGDVYVVTTSYGDLQLGRQVTPASTHWEREFLVGSVASAPDTLAPTPANLPVRAFDDGFDSDTAPRYTVVTPSSWEQAPAPTVADGKLSVGASAPFFSVLLTGLPVAATDTAVIVEADTFLASTTWENSLFAGVAKSGQDYALTWYNHHRGQLGIEVRSGGKVAPYWGHVSTRLVSGDKLAVVFSGRWMTAYRWHDGQWQRLHASVVNGSFDFADPSVRSQFQYAAGLRGDRGTISIGSVQALSR